MSLVCNIYNPGKILLHNTFDTTVLWELKSSPRVAHRRIISGACRDKVNKTEEAPHKNQSFALLSLNCPPFHLETETGTCTSSRRPKINILLTRHISSIQVKLRTSNLNSAHPRCHHNLKLGTNVNLRSWWHMLITSSWPRRLR